MNARARELLAAAPIAHRGLWDQASPENTLAAFAAACAAGYGVELDVQLSRDGEAMVFHDDRLGRLTDDLGRLAERTAVELSALRIGGTDETIPTLGETLAAIHGRSPVLVELKVLGDEEGALEVRVAELLDAYDGPFALLSFNPRSLRWFAERRPGWLRGLNSTGYREATDWVLEPAQRESLAAFEHVALAAPDFLSLSVDMVGAPPAEAARARGLPVIAWTVRSAAQRARLADRCDNIMFEGFRA